MSKANVVVYTTPTCVYCHALMAWLEEKGIAFEERDLSDEKVRKKAEKALGYAISLLEIKKLKALIVLLSRGRSNT